MTLSKTFVGTAILAIYGMFGAAISGQGDSRISLSKSACQAQTLNFSMDDDSLCEAARQLAAWVCGNSMRVGIDQLTDGFVDKVDGVTWVSLKPLIISSIAEIDTILDPNKSPSLSPPDAGSWALAIDTSSMTTEVMGDDLCERAQAAADEICNSEDPDHEYAGMLIRQMRWMLEDLFDQAQP